MRYTLENEYLLVEADENGAELTSIRSKKDFTEYLWQADERYWRRHAPVRSNFAITDSIFSPA